MYCLRQNQEHQICFPLPFYPDLFLSFFIVRTHSIQLVNWADRRFSFSVHIIQLDFHIVFKRFFFAFVQTISQLLALICLTFWKLSVQNICLRNLTLFPTHTHLYTKLCELWVNHLLNYLFLQFVCANRSKRWTPCTA